MPSKMPTSAVNAAFPVPSTIFAPRINVSSMYITSFFAVYHTPRPLGKVISPCNLPCRRVYCGKRKKGALP